MIWRFWTEFWEWRERFRGMWSRRVSRVGRIRRCCCAWVVTSDRAFFIAKPMPAEAVAEWVQSWQVGPLCKNWRRAGRDDMPVLFAMVQHRAWVADLRRYFRGERSTPPPLDVHECRFGRWLDRFGADYHAGNPAIARIVHLHQEIHECASRLVDLHQSTKRQEAYVCLRDVEWLRENLIEALQELLDQPSPRSQYSAVLDWPASHHDHAGTVH